MSSDDGMRKAATVLLLVGAILSAVGTLFMLALTFGMAALFEALDNTGGESSVVLIVYGGLSLLLLAGTAACFVAWNHAKNQQWDQAFAWGIVGSMLPPIQIVPLLGAIFAKVSQDD